MALYKNKYLIESTRRRRWDYRWNSAYFITLVTKNRERFFGQVVKGEMQRTALGDLAHDFWLEIPQHFPGVMLGAMVIMPDHMHGVLVLYRSESDPGMLLPDRETKPDLLVKDGRQAHLSAVSPKAGSVSTIVRSYKSVVSREGRKICPHFGWQARYHDIIIPDERAYDNIRNYILNNPGNWKGKE